MSKKTQTVKITLTDEELFYLDFLVADENVRQRGIMVGRLISKAIKSRKTEDRPIYPPVSSDDANAKD